MLTELWAFAVNQVIQNLDCYNTYYIHNYYLYQTKDGLFQMIPWDLDNSFAGAIMGWDFGILQTYMNMILIIVVVHIQDLEALHNHMKPDHYFKNY